MARAQETLMARAYNPWFSPHPRLFTNFPSGCRLWCMESRQVCSEICRVREVPSQLSKWPSTDICHYCAHSNLPNFLYAAWHFLGTLTGSPAQHQAKHFGNVCWEIRQILWSQMEGRVVEDKRIANHRDLKLPNWLVGQIPSSSAKAGEKWKTKANPAASLPPPQVTHCTVPMGVRTGFLSITGFCWLPFCIGISYVNQRFSPHYK